jgi:hypothetical protein
MLAPFQIQQWPARKYDAVHPEKIRRDQPAQGVLEAMSGNKEAA